MARANETSEASNETHKPDAEIKGVTFKFGFDMQMEDTGALDAEADTAGEQAKEPEDEADANMSDWNEEDHTPTIRSEVEKASSKLPKASKAKKH
jgi:hypothetical protein